MGEKQLRLEGGEDRRVALAQYDTPPELAARQVAMIAGEPGGRLFAPPRTVLEPSAGNGALVRALFAVCPNARVDAVELDEVRAAELRRLVRGDALCVVWGDYLADRACPRFGERYDLCLSNPPFSRGVECDHLAKMFSESERVIVQLPIRALHGQERYRRLWSRIGREFWLRAEVRVAERVYPNASDDIVLCDFRREPGPCAVSWWVP